MIAQFLKTDAHARVLGKSALQIPGDNVKVSLRCRLSNPRLQPADHKQIVIIASVHVVVGCPRQRCPQLGLGLVKETKTLRHDCKYGKSSPTEVDLPADNHWIAAELPLPQPIAQENNPMFAPLLVPLREALA